MPNDLKPCPFCGCELVAKNEIWKSPVTGITKTQTVYCHPQRDCLLDYHRFHFYAYPHKEEQWNRRADNG